MFFVLRTTVTHDCNARVSFSFARTAADLRAPGLPSSDDYVDEVMQMYDGDGDRTVDKKEFVGFVRKREKALWNAFQSLDLDKNGRLGRPPLCSHARDACFRST